MVATGHTITVPQASAKKIQNAVHSGRVIKTPQVTHNIDPD